MAYCSHCQIEVDGRFCPQCGQPLEEASSPGAGSGQVAQTPGPAASSAAGMSQNVAATLCYVLGLITGILFLVLEPYNRDKLIRFHAFQSIFLSVAALLVSVALNIILPFWISLVVSPLVSLFWFGLWIFLLWKTYQGQKVVLPVVGALAEQQA